ncbi:hypothetical protein ACLB2K_013215 [Fragaria x ananassa]
MKILSWNSRGSAWDGFVAQTCFYVSCVDVDVLCILDTRAPFDSISNKLKNLPFDKSYGIAASGQCGGLTVLWKSMVVKIDVIEPHDRFIHCLIKDLVTSKSFYASFVYAYPQKDRQAAFWSVVAQLQPANEEGWVLIGDVNTITTLDEKLGGNQVVAQYMGNLLTKPRLGKRMFLETYLFRKLEDLHERNPCIDDADNDLLLKQITDDELWEAVNAIGALKAPGPDGLHASFYQNCWMEIKDTVIPMIKDPVNAKELLLKLTNKLAGWKKGTLSRADMKCPHVAWEQVCQPKAVGGLSIRPAGFFNNAALAKLAWKVISVGFPGIGRGQTIWRRGRRTEVLRLGASVRFEKPEMTQFLEGQHPNPLSTTMAAASMSSSCVNLNKSPSGVQLLNPSATIK